MSLRKYCTNAQCQDPQYSWQVDNYLRKENYILIGEEYKTLGCVVTLALLFFA